MNAGELFKAGQLQAAVDAQLQEVKRNPADEAERVFLGELLVLSGNLDRARQKLVRKNADLIVFNPIGTMNSDMVEATLLYADGRTEALPSRGKHEFADILIQRAAALFA